MKAKAPGEAGDGEAPIKTCPECMTIVHASVSVCPDCGYEWPAPIPKIDRRAAQDIVLSSQIEAKPVGIDRVTYSRHEKRGKPDSLKVEYWGGNFERYAEWVCFEHKGYARKKAEKWWSKRCGLPAPTTITRALSVTKSLAEPSTIWVRQNGRYFDIVEVEFDGPCKEKEMDSGSESKRGNLAFLAA